LTIRRLVLIGQQKINSMKLLITGGAGFTPYHPTIGI